MDKGFDQQQDSEQAGWSYNAGQADEPKFNAQQPSSGEGPVKWSASEYIANPKNSAWFVGLTFAVVAISMGVYFITSDMVTTIVIILTGIAFGVFAARQPKTLEYTVGDSGLQFGPKFYHYDNFKSFSVVNDGAFSRISLSPLKRFMPPLSLHYSPEDEEKIIKILADHLPYEEPKQDLIENIAKKIRF